jgi:hypothetical protein
VNPQGIRTEVERQAESVAGANALRVALLGDPGIFAPAYISYWMRWMRPPSGPPLWDLLDRLFPAQIYECTRPKEYFATIAEAFNATSIPIMFNG